MFFSLVFLPQKFKSYQKLKKGGKTYKRLQSQGHVKIVYCFKSLMLIVCLLAGKKSRIKKKNSCRFSMMLVLQQLNYLKKIMGWAWIEPGSRAEFPDNNRRS